MVRLSTIPVVYMMLPQMVDFPASTWPMNTTLMFSRGSSLAMSSSRENEVVWRVRRRTNYNSGRFCFGNHFRRIHIEKLRLRRSGVLVNSLLGSGRSRNRWNTSCCLRSRSRSRSRSGSRSSYRFSSRFRSRILSQDNTFCTT